MTEAAKKEVNMTEGNIREHIIRFALPLVLGYLFQQLYTTVDSVVVGQVVGKEALAAVGTTAPIINTLIGFFTGFSTGASVIIAKNFGAHNNEKVSEAVHTSMLVIFLSSVFATVLGVFTVPYMLGFMNTPADVYSDAYDYLVIYFWGIASLMIYNMGSSILRAVGDSKRPLYYLVCSSIINIVFDIIFVKYMNMGVAGAAYATVMSQIVSAVLVLISLTVSKSSYRLIWKELKISKQSLAEILHIGMPTAIQSSLTSFSNVFVRSYINDFGSTVMAGWTSYSKIDEFIVIPINSISMGATTFIGQNLGAGDVTRAHKGTRESLVLGSVATFLLIVPLCIFAPQIVSMFNPDPEVVECGAYLIRMISPFYLAWGVCMVYSAALCGAGDTKYPTLFKFFSFVVFRQAYLFFVTQVTDSLFAVVMGFPIGWTLSAILVAIYYRIKSKEFAMRFYF